MGKNNKRIQREKMTIESFTPTFDKIKSMGIEIDKKFCDGGHSYVVHAWIGDSVKCNLFMKTLRWVPFGFHKGVSGCGLDELKCYLMSHKDYDSTQELPYCEKIKRLREVLEAVRNGTNFDIIDDAIKKYC